MGRRRKSRRQDSRSYVVLLYALAAVLFLMVFGLSGKFSAVQEATEGYSVLSLQSVDIKSNMFGNGSGILLTLAVDGSGDKARGTITTETLKRWGLSGVNISDFTIYVYLEELKYNYPLTQAKYFSGEDVILYKVVGSTAKQECLAKELPWGAVSKDTSIDYYYGKPVKTQLVTTVPPIMPRGIEKHIPAPPYNKAKAAAVEIGEWGYWMPEGKVKVTYVKDQWGRTRSVEYDFGAGECQLEGVGKGDWFVTNLAGIPYARVYDIGTSAIKDYRIRVVLKGSNGQEVSAVLTPDRRVDTLGNVGRVKMLGDLGGERTPEVPAVDYRVIKFLDYVPDETTRYGAAVKPGAFKFVGKDVIDTYKSSLMKLADLDNNYYTFEVEEGMRRIKVDPDVGAGFIVGQWNTLNNMLAASIEDSRTPATCSIVGSVVSCEGKGGVSYPLIQIILKADKVGLELMSGEPQIVDVDVPPKIYEGEPAIIRAKIKNNGEVADSFDVALSCPSEVSTTTDRIGLAPGESGVSTITVVSSISGQYNCTLKMGSTTGAVYDEEPVRLTVVQKPLPQEITMLRDIPQRVDSLTSSVEALTRTVNILLLVLMVLVGGAILGGLAYLVYRMRR